jgi:phospholipid/cholesterol/gamma-HCH transport system substrate-binding protein
MRNRLRATRARLATTAVAAALVVSGCGFTPYDLPLPGGADLGDRPYTVKAEFRDAMDIVPQGGVRSSDVTVGRITDVRLKPGGWTAEVTMQINGDTKLPDNTLATIRQTSLLGEKFISLDVPDDGAGYGQLGDGDVIGLSRSGRNPELEEVLSAAALLFNGGGLDKINTITRELGALMDGREDELRDFIENSTAFTEILDQNKGAVISALEKIDRFAKATSAQEDAIDEALRDIPPALQVIDDQRDDLVKMLEALENLSDVATNVIKKAKRDTLKNLRDLEPILRELANGGDSLVDALRSLLAFPFTDNIVKDSVAQAMEPCPADTVEVVRAGVCFGDYWNLDIDLALNEQQALRTIYGLLSIGGLTLPGGSLDPAAASAASSKASAKAAKQSQPAAAAAADQASEPVDAAPEPPPPTAKAADANEKPSGGGLCSFLGLCRPAAADYVGAQRSDLGKILVEPVVAE